MPPKKGGGDKGPSKKTEMKKKEKVIEVINLDNYLINYPSLKFHNFK